MSWGTVHTEPIVPLGLIGLLGLLGFFSTLLQFWVLRKKVGRGRALLISLFRLGALLGLITIAFNPLRITQREHGVRPTLAILLETSQSMKFPGRGPSRTRLDEAKEVLLGGSRPLLKSLTERYEVKIYGLGQSLVPLEIGQIASLSAGGKQGDLSQAIAKIREQSPVVLLLSDGKLRWHAKAPNGPSILSIPLGDPETYKDVLIKEVKAPPMAFREREVVLDVILRSYGYKGILLPVVLQEGNRLLSARTVPIRQSPEEVKLSFSFIPQRTGPQLLTISVLPQVDEAMSQNNSVDLPLRVFRDKIRVLMISGSPSMNYRFMRTGLKNDPSIDLLSFIILRTPSDILNVPLQEQSLIPFPVETLFTKELGNFDVLIFDNFSHQLYLKPTYLENVRDFVNRGGGLAMIGGPNGFSGYVRTPLEEILPVILTQKEDYRRDRPLPVQLAAAGRNHPITRLSSDEKENRTLWTEMAPVDGLNLLQAKNTGSVLVETKGPEPIPLLTVAPYGKGRVAVISTDYCWKWYIARVAQGEDPWAYFKLTERLFRWLSGDPMLGPVEVVFPEGAGGVGEEIEIKILVREGYIKAAKNEVSLSVIDPDGLKVEARLRPTPQPDRFLATFVPQKPGNYRVRVETPTGSLEEALSVSESTKEADAFPDHERLKEISLATGGKVLNQSDDLLREVEARAGRDVKGVIEERRFPLWATGGSFSIILLCLAMEWFLRRRSGLL